MEQNTLLSKVVLSLQRYSMLNAGEAVLCGFSGGADSVTLLSVLWTLSKGVGELPPFDVYACHVHHGIRGAEADEDEAFCKNFCQERDIPFLVLHADVPALAKVSGESLETCGRNVRYRFFQETAAKLLEEHPEYTGVKVATAHTASDNAETMLFHLARGTGLLGLSGIPPVRENIIRPLIACSREDIEAYCQAEHLSFVTDSTNEDTAYARNKIRHNILPALTELNAGAVENMQRSARTLRRDAEFFEAQVEDLLNAARRDNQSFRADVLKKAPDAILVRALSTLLTDFSGVQAENRHVETVLSWLREDAKFKQLQVPGGAYATLAGERLLLQWPTAPAPSTPVVSETFRSEELVQWMVAEGESPVKKVALRKLPLETLERQHELLENCLDYDKIDSNFILRTRQPGDTFAPAGRGVHKKLKSLYQEAGVPVEERSRKLLLEQDGQVLWLEGFGPAEGVSVTETTRFVWYVEVQ